MSTRIVFTLRRYHEISGVIPKILWKVYFAVSRRYFSIFQLKNYLPNWLHSILRGMEFTAIVFGETYHFSSLNRSSFLVSGNRGEYILYKTSKWNCADEISTSLVVKLGEVIEQKFHVLHWSSQVTFNYSSFPGDQMLLRIDSSIRTGPIKPDSSSGDALW